MRITSLLVCAVVLMASVSSSRAQTAFNRTEPYGGFYAVASFNPVLGIKTIRTIKIQLSFRYKVNDDDLVDTYFGYTMRSFWAIDQGSHPFKELVFNPEAWLQTSPDNPDDPEFRVGIEHESNGLSGPDSRGWNKLYVQVGDTWRSDDGDWSSRHALRLWHAFAVSKSTKHMVEHHAVIGPVGYDLIADLLEERPAGNAPGGNLRASVRVKKWPLPSKTRPGFLELDLQSRWKNAVWHGQLFRGYGERLIPSAANDPVAYPRNGYRPLKAKLGLSLLD